MAHAIYPNDTQSPQPPSYESSNQEYMKTTYSNQTSPSYGSPNSVPSTPIYNQPIVGSVIGMPFLGQNPTPIQCPRCQQQVITAVQYESGTGTWLIALVICIFGGVFGCCLIPFCVPQCQDAVHTCPACKSYIGRRNLI